MNAQPKRFCKNMALGVFTLPFSCHLEQLGKCPMCMGPKLAHLAKVA